MRYRVYDDARYANGAVAAGRTLTVYNDAAMTTKATLYTAITGTSTVANPLTIPSTGIVDFWVADRDVWGLSQGDSVARPLHVIEAPSEVLNVKDFGATGDGTTDDTAAVQAVLDAATDNTTILFPAGSYLVGQLSLSPHDGLTISGYGATLKSALGVNAAMPAYLDYTLIENLNNADWLYTNLVPAADITAGDTTLTMTGSNLSGLQAGDIVIIKTTKVVAATYQAGSYRKVVSEADDVITLDAEIETSLDVTTDAVKVDIVRASNDLTIAGLRIELVTSGGQAGMWLKYLNGCVVRDVTVVGGGTKQAVGISLEGFGLRAENCRIEGPFWDANDNLGYGIAMAGHDTLVKGCSIRQCRHGVAHGSSAFINSHMAVADSYFDDAELDAHGSCQYVNITGNRITQVGKNKSYATSGIYLRCRHTQVVGNTVLGAATPVGSNGGIRLMELCDEDLVISGNTILGVTYGIYWNSLTGAEVNDITIVGNRIEAAYGIYNPYEMSGASISGNSITANYGIDLKGGDDVVISGNRIGFGAAAFGHGILLDTEETQTWKRWMVSGNTLYSLTASGTNGIYIGNAYDDIVVSGNIFDLSQTASHPAINITAATSLTRFVRFNNLGDAAQTIGTTAPAAGTWLKGDVCWNSSPDSTEDVGWVCTVAGEPGTWKSFGTVAS